MLARARLITLFSILVLSSATAHAADELTSSGLTLGPARAFPNGQDGLNIRSVPLALDTSDRFLRRPAGGGTECWDLSGAAPVRVNVVTPPTQTFMMVGARLSSDLFIVANAPSASSTQHDFVRGGCGVAATSLGSASLAGTLVPALRTSGFGAFDQIVSPVLSGGDFIYSATGGLARVSFATATPTPSIWGSSASLSAPLAAVPLPAGVTPTFAVLALGASPDDHVWAVVSRTWVVNSGIQYTVGNRFALEIDPAGVVSLRHGPDSLGGEAPPVAIYDASLNAMLLLAHGDARCSARSACGTARAPSLR